MDQYLFLSKLKNWIEEKQLKLFFKNTKSEKSN